MTETLAVYGEVGATLAVPQIRPKDPSAIDGIFCRRDKGKWKGLGTAGAEMRKFEFQAALLAAGKRKQRARDRLGAKIRKECKRSMDKVRKVRLGRLLAKARSLKGSRHCRLGLRRQVVQNRFRHLSCADIPKSFLGGLG